MPAALADNTAAVAEGYTRTQVDRGASAVGGRYTTVYTDAYDGDSQAGGIRQITGRADDVQATADANALASLNAVRGYIYGVDGTNVNKGSRSGATLVVGRN